MGEEYIRRIMVLGEVPSLGPVILFDNMEDLLKWAKSGTGGDDLIEKSQTLVYNKDYCLHIKTRTTGATMGDVISATRRAFQRPGKRYRLECIWVNDASTGSSQDEFGVDVFDQTFLHQVAVRWDAANERWDYFSSGAAWVAIPGGAQLLATDVHHRFLVEFDQVKKEYIRLVSDELEVDMTGIAYRTSANAAGSSVRINLKLVAGSGPPGETYFDDVLVMEI